ncbi:hypothetical protein PERMA_1305 [Persephonella marina EX-H1]|uniref:Uncharacterized protein n=1 Tax=Persephonella marina (strain DSM 14350 / EX-H1) TaxID=123214 RepID=C0QQY0_PERMH|nr:hypothetical protein PERMA_1305 [Persephonella marina EX-H1]
MLKALNDLKDKVVEDVKKPIVCWDRIYVQLIFQFEDRI